MSTALLERLETQLDDLSEIEQRQLLDRLTELLGPKARRQPSSFAAELDAMANDPDIRRELVSIEEEFRVADSDGLDMTP